MKPDADELLPTRASLLHRLKDWQDQASWQDFFDTYWKLIYGVARKAGLGDAEAQDVVQETLAAVAKHIPTFHYDPSIGSFKAWLLTMTRWRIIGQLRKRGRFADPLPGNTATNATAAIEQIPDDTEKTISAYWEADWEANLLHAAISKVKRRLDPKKFQLFEFYVNKEWPAEKVAERFQVSVDQVYVNKHRVTDAIRAEVRRLEKEMV
jgi:RNA polymerase sigma factor (sigma-70 family)